MTVHEDGTGFLIEMTKREFDNMLTNGVWTNHPAIGRLCIAIEPDRPKKKAK